MTMRMTVVDPSQY